MFDSHLIPGRKKVHGKEVVFDLTQSGLQVGTSRPLQTMPAIKKYLRDHDLTKVLDFGAGRLRNTRSLAKGHSLEVWFSEFGVVHSHELRRDDLANSKALAKRFHKKSDRPSEYLWNKLGERTRGLLSTLPPEGPSKILVGLMLDDLNPVLWEDRSFYESGAFDSQALPDEVGALASTRPQPRSTRLLRLNRYLIETAYPRMISPSARTHVYPHEFPDDRADYDAILLSYVLHTLPHPEDREEVLAACRDKLRKGGLLMIASPKYNSPIHRTLEPADQYDIGWVRGLSKPSQTFYSEPSPDDLKAWVKPFGFKGLVASKDSQDGQPLVWKQRSAHVLGFVRG